MDLEGTNHLDIIILYRVPNIRNMSPSLVNSNMENGVRLYFAIMELTIRFVEVPISVSVPPKIAA